MTQPTVSKHGRKIDPKDQTSIPSGQPHHAHNITTMQYETKTHKIHTDKHKTVLKARTLYMFCSNYERLPESV